MSRKKALRIAACIHSIYNDCDTPDSFSKRLVRQVMNNDIVQEGSGGRRDEGGEGAEQRRGEEERKRVQRKHKRFKKDRQGLRERECCNKMVSRLRGGGPGEASDLSSRGYSSAGME